MKQAKSLNLGDFNAVIVGNGAIGSALLDVLLSRKGLRQIVILGRSVRPVPEDPRVSFLAFDAEHNQSVVDAAARVEQSLGRVHLLIKKNKSYFVIQKKVFSSS